MTPLLDTQLAARDALTAYSSLRQHHSSEPYKACAEWLSALIAQIQAAMTNCGPEKLIHMQVRLKQLMSLRSALVDPGGATTGYTFD